MTRFRLALLLAFLSAAGGRADEPKLLAKIAFGPRAIVVSCRVETYIAANE